MNTSMNKRLKAAVVMVGLGWCVGRAEAYKNPDSILLNVAPANAQYSVSIASPSATPGYDFEQVNLAATTESTQAIVVTNDGTVSEFFSLKTENSNGGWAPVTTTPAMNQFRLVGLFQSGQPAASNYAVSGSTVTTSFPDPAGSSYGQGGTRTTATSTKNLWLQLTMPNDVTTGSNAQTIRLYVNGQGL